MATLTSVGSSAGPQTEHAAKSAIQQALGRLTGKPDWGVVFAAHKHDLGRVLTVAREMLPGVAIMGSSTAGEIGERGLSNNTVSVMLVQSNDMACALRLASETSKNYQLAAQRLCQGLDAEARAAAQKHMLEPASIILGDALQGPFEKLVTEMRRMTKPHHKMVGGAAGDDATFTHTPAGMPGSAGPDQAVALHLFSRAPIGVGIGHGFEPLTEKMTVTKSTGPLISEVDGKPAFQVFVDYAASRGFAPQRADETPIEFLTRIGGSLFGVFFFDDVCRVRGAHRVTPEGGVYVSGEIPEGSQICVIGADASALVGAARAAAAEARGNLKGRPAAGVLVFSCITRKFVLGDQYNREVSAVRAVFPDVPISGFLSYGEIARFNGRLDGYHNATCVVAALPAHAD